MQFSKMSWPVVALMIAALGVAGCATDGSHKNAGIGAGSGAGLGAAIGAIFGGKHKGRNAAIGAAAGALAGGAAGHYMDRQYKELEQNLAAHSDEGDLRLDKMDDQTLRIGIASDASFAFDSADLDSDAKGIFMSIANILQNYDKTAIHVVGFTDSVGNSAYNKQLSKRRAQTVAGFLSSHGVSSQRVRVWGRGESQPVASNETADGQAKNRRVEIILKPIVEGQENAAFSEPPNLGNPQYK